MFSPDFVTHKFNRLPQAEAGSEFIQFSPADQLAATQAAINKALPAS